MPDIRLTWGNIREHLRKFIWVYIVAIAVSLAAGHLLWTVTQPRPPEERRVLIYLAGEWCDANPLKPVGAEVLRRLQAEGADVDEVAFEGLRYVNAEEDYMSSMLLMSRLALGDGDVYLANQAAFDALAAAGACLPLDDSWHGGWMRESGLEPCFVPPDGDGGQMLALRLDAWTALTALRAFDNEGAYLVIAANGGNIESSMRAVECLTEWMREGAQNDD